MTPPKPKRSKLSERISSYVASDQPLRDLAGNLSKVARTALDEANTLTVEKIMVELERLPAKLDGFKIVHLSDTHHSRFTDLEHISRAVDIANGLEPDAVFLTGDYVSHDADYIAPVADVLGNLKSEFGTYACLGNHDHWTDADLVTHLLRGEGIKVLINEGLRFEARDAAFWLAGVDDYMAGKTDLRAALRGSFPDEMKVLLAHNPVIFRQSVRANIDLTLSGHTHGGQIKMRDPDRKDLAAAKAKQWAARSKGFADLHNTRHRHRRRPGPISVPTGSDAVRAAISAVNMSSILTIPNLLTFMRMALIPVFASMLFYGHYKLALTFFVIAGISDGIDGFLARRFKQESELGTIIDPIADKLLMTTAFIILSIPNVLPAVRHLPVPFWVTITVIGRDILILVVAAAINVITGFRGFRPSWLGKLSTLVQVVAVTLILLSAVTGISVYLPTTYSLVVLLAFVSGAHYVFQVATLMNEQEKNPEA